MKPDNFIAVFDSGVGGISVLRQLRKLMPGENYIYYGDSANAPYGSRTTEEVRTLTLAAAQKLTTEYPVKALVVACNTATAVAAAELRARYTLPIIGIEPAVKPAALLCDAPRVLVMATPLTLREEKFLSLVSRFSDRAEVISLPCPGLVELIEGGHLDDGEVDGYCRRLLTPYRELKIDAVVLGCTHYPHVRSVIARHLPGAEILDGGEGTARETFRRVKEQGLLNPSEREGEIQMINSSEEERLVELSWELLERGLGRKVNR